MNGVTTLARAAAATRWDNIPDESRAQAADLFRDTLAVISAGLVHSSYAPFAQAHCSGTGQATVPGFAEGVPLHAAVLVNGGATTVLQLQDGHRLARGHPASHLVPALLSVAEEKQASIEQVMSAFVAGYEVGARVGIAMGGMNQALHDTGTWSTIATAVAVTHLLTEGNADLIGAAIEAAAAIAPMPYRETAPSGATVHHLYIGIGATTGITVATAVLAGLSPLPGTLDGFFGPRAAAAYDPGKLTQGIDSGDKWSHYELLDAYIKVHPTCAHLHGVNDAVAGLIKEHALTADDVAKVEVGICAAAHEFDNPAPDNDLAARFSASATIAIALHDGKLGITNISDDKLDAPGVRDLMQRVHVSYDPKLDAGYPEGRPSRVDISCHDGRDLTLSIIHPLGDCTNPLGGAARRAKARELFSHRFGEAATDEILSVWDDVVVGGRLASLSHALRAPAIE